MSKSYKIWIILMANCIGIFLCMLDTTVMNIALPDIQTSLKVTLNSLSWPLNIYTIIFAALTIPLGKLAENIGIKHTYLIGLAVFTIGSVISSLSTSLIHLMIGRGIQSLGASIVFPLSMTIGINLVSLESRKKTIAALGITQGLAAALGPSIGGVLTQFLGWRWIFIINIPLTILSIILCLISFDLKNDKRTKESIDFLGALLCITMLSTLVLSLVQGRSWGWLSIPIITSLIISFVSVICFVTWEIHTSNPMIPMDLFKNHEFTGSAIAIVLSNLFLVAVTVVLPTYFVRIQNKSELTAALLITPITGMIFIFSPLAALIIDKLGARMVIAFGFILITISYVLFTNINMNNILLVVITCLILGSGYGIIAGPITVLAASDFEGSLLTASQSVAGVLRQVGISLAVAIYVTSLYANMVTAKSNSTNYINEQVAKLDISQSKKQAIINRSVNSLGKNSSKISTNHFSKKDRQQFINLAYQQELAKYPDLTDQTQKSNIYDKVKTTVETTLDNLNHKINQVITRIKNYARHQYELAFIKLYKYSIPFAALSILSFLFFPKKKTKN